ncbi:hypothetical protein SDC9_129858 [bioreactor metagenome]|uniref:Uncharacterized protein n=1 Tax=bioreactor metagenome TaxID=1076179 RepID=A0A645D057_9ZZZZ
MRIEKILFAEQQIELAVPQTNIKKMALVNPTLSFGVPYIPTVFTFTLFVMLEGVTETFVEMNVRFINSSNSKIVFEQSFPIDANNESTLAKVLPFDVVGTNYGIQVNNINIENEGSYECIVSLNEGETKSERLRFVQRRAIENPE